MLIKNDCGFTQFIYLLIVIKIQKNVYWVFILNLQKRFPIAY